MATEELASSSRLTPFRIAVIYLLVGGAWVLLSDRFVAVLPLDPGLAAQVQTAKGWLFVGASALLVYGLAARGRSQIRRTNRRLNRAVQQSSVLHRVLRHNLRNACNVIELRAEELSALARDGEESRRTIERQVDSLLELGKKSGHLRRIALGHRERRAIDLCEVVEREVAYLETDNPDVDVDVDLPPAAPVSAYPELEIAVRELLENAVKHAHADGPSIRIGVRQTGGAVTMDVADDGPGLPEMERDVLERGLEKPLSHSQGLGLWIVRVIVGESGGELRVVDNEPEGTIVRIRLQAAEPPRPEVVQGPYWQTV